MSICILLNSAQDIPTNSKVRIHNSLACYESQGAALTSINSSLMRFLLCINVFQNKQGFVKYCAILNQPLLEFSLHFYEMPDTPVKKYISPLTPITYTVGALLAKQMGGELCIPKVASLLSSAPDSSVFYSSWIMCSLPEMHLNRHTLPVEWE